MKTCKTLPGMANVLLVSELFSFFLCSKLGFRRSEHIDFQARTSRPRSYYRTLSRHSERTLGLLIKNFDVDVPYFRLVFVCSDIRLGALRYVSKLELTV